MRLVSALGQGIAAGAALERVASAAALDPVVGNEISKTRPVLVVSNNINNRYAGTVTVLPITSKKLNKMYPFELLLPKGTGNLPKDSKVKADQINKYIKVARF